MMSVCFITNCPVNYAIMKCHLIIGDQDFKIGDEDIGFLDQNKLHDKNVTPISSIDSIMALRFIIVARNPKLHGVGGWVAGCHPPVGIR